MPQKNLYICWLVLCVSFSLFSQTDVCPEVTINNGNPTFVNCNSETGCINLEANYPEIGVTTDYNVQAIEYNPQFPFSGLSHLISVNIDDVWSDPKIQLPFDFSFYGQKYSEAVISSNGAISFNLNNTNNNGHNTSAPSTPENEDFCPWKFNLGIPNANFPTVGEVKKIRNAIFGVFHDIDPSKGGQIGWDIFGDYPCRKLVVSFYRVPLFECENVTSTFQIVLYESTNSIVVNIENKPSCSNWNGGNSLIGLQNATGNMGITPPYRNTGNWAAQNESWKFTASGETNTQITWYDVTNGNQVIGDTDVINVCPNSENIYKAEVTFTLSDGSTITVDDLTTVTFNNEITSETPFNFTLCDDDTVQDGLTEINLRDTEEGIILELNSDNPSPITYHLTLQDAKDAINPIPYAYAFQNSVNPQQVYGRLEDTTTGCCLIKPISYFITTEPIVATAKVTSKKFGDMHQMTAFVEGNASYLFSIDGNEFQTDPIYNNVFPGTHTVTITDTNFCFEKTIRLVILDYPNFFTPNGDGINDTWVIRNREEFTASTIHIFDRYGKPLFQIKQQNKIGWDGLHNNNQLPAADYWFKIVYTENSDGIQQETMGHFTLKR